MADHSNLKKNANATVRTGNELMSLDSSVTQIIIDNGVSASNFTVLDLTRFTQLRLLEVGNHCFTFVNELNITGLSELESVKIGSKSFRDDDSKGGSFYLKNCPKLRELRITGVRSFEYFDVIEIENVDALEVIKMGELNEESRNFRYASLELKSILIHSE